MSYLKPANILPEPHRSVLIAAGNNCISAARESGKNVSFYDTASPEYQCHALNRDAIIETLQRATGGRFWRIEEEPQ